MKTGAAGLALIKSFEECRLVAFLPTGRDIPTIGWGHTRGVKLGDTCTQEQADAWLAMDLATAEADVMRYVDVPLTQNQFDALVSFDYNLGATDFRDSTLLKYLNQRKFQLCSGEILKWNKQGGVILAGLIRRRKAEATLFDTP